MEINFQLLILTIPLSQIRKRVFRNVDIWYTTLSLVIRITCIVNFIFFITTEIPTMDEFINTFCI